MDVVLRSVSGVVLISVVRVQARRNIEHPTGQLQLILALHSLLHPLDPGALTPYSFSVRIRASIPPIPYSSKLTSRGYRSLLFHIITGLPAMSPCYIEIVR